jgi:transposase
MCVSGYRVAIPICVVGSMAYHLRYSSILGRIHSPVSCSFSEDAAGDLIKILCWDGQGLCLFSKRLEKGRFVWPQAKDGAISLTAAQLSMLLEGIDWRMPARTWQPEMAN